MGVHVGVPSYICQQFKLVEGCNQGSIIGKGVCHGFPDNTLDIVLAISILFEILHKISGPKDKQTFSYNKPSACPPPICTMYI